MGKGAETREIKFLQTFETTYTGVEIKGAILFLTNIQSFDSTVAVNGAIHFAAILRAFGLVFAEI